MVNRIGIIALLLGIVVSGQVSWAQQRSYNNNRQSLNTNTRQYESPAASRGSLSSSSSGLGCPEKNGRFPTTTCDAYIECIDGVATQKTCSDGLLFNSKVGIFTFPCQYPVDVDCTGREATQPPQPTEQCPHQFGYYAMGDAQNCGQFKNCVNGHAFIFDCPEGLAFSDDTYRCDWPDMVPQCDAEAYLGFTCPPEARSAGLHGYQYFRSERDCHHYYICVDGRPRLYNCGEGRAFHVENNTCVDAEDVPGCAVAAGVGAAVPPPNFQGNRQQANSLNFNQAKNRGSYRQQETNQRQSNFQSRTTNQRNTNNNNNSNNNYQGYRSTFRNEQTTQPYYYTSSRPYRNY